MKQQRFEDILFSDKKLSSSEKKEIQIIVQENPESASLYENWSAVKLQLSKPSQQAPESGFTERWRVRQQADQRRKVQAQAFWAILLTGLAAIATAYFAVGSTQSMLILIKDFFISAANQLLEFSSFFQILGRVAFSILQKFPPSWWASMAMALVLLPMLWFVVYRELSTSKGVQL